MRKKGVKSWPLYIFGPGVLSWYGLYSAHLHPALALVAIVPFLPAGDHGDHSEENSHSHDSPLVNYLHSTSVFVDFGLFFFAFANAGVQFSSISTITWVIFLSLIAGKTVGIFGLSYLGKLLGFALPDGMDLKDLVVTGMIAGIGLTVALFVAGVAYTDGLVESQGPAKMGALLSGLGFLFAWILAKIFGIKPLVKKSK